MKPPVPLTPDEMTELGSLLMPQSACNHAWETMEQCFECGAIRPAQDEPTPILDDEMKGCPMKTKDAKEELETLRRMIRELAGCEWQGKDVTTKRLIFEARKAAGWKRTDWTK